MFVVVVLLPVVLAMVGKMENLGGIYYRATITIRVVFKKKIW